MSLPAPTYQWAEEQKRWRQEYHDRLLQQLQHVAARLLRDRARPYLLRPHFQSCLSLLNHTRELAYLNEAWLDLVSVLHPLPERWGQWEAWLDVLKLAADKSRALGTTPHQASYLAYAARILLEIGLLSAAEEKARLALSLARRCGAVAAYGLSGSVLVAACRFLGRTDEAARILADCQAELPRLPADGNTAVFLQAAVLLDLEQMDLERHRGNLAGSIDLADRIVARATADSANLDAHWLALVYRRRATISWAAGRYAAAADDLHQAMELFHQAGDEQAAVFTEGNLGLVYYSMASYDRAEAAMREAIHTAEQLNARWWMIRDIGNLTGVYMARGEMETALVYARRHLDLARQFDDQAEISRARANLGMSLVYLGRAAEGVADVEASLKQSQADERPEGAIAGNIDMALCCAGLGRDTEAAALAEQAYAAANELDFPTLKILAARCLACFRSPHEQQALLEQALALSRQHGRLLDEAGCLLSLAALAPNYREKQDLWQKGAALLQLSGAQAWLNSASPDHPPLVAMIL